MAIGSYEEYAATLGDSPSSATADPAYQEYVSKLGRIPETPQAAIPTAKPGFIGDIQRSTGQIAGSVGATLSDVSRGAIGPAMEKWGSDVASAHPSEIQSAMDIVRKPVTTTREAVGEAIPQAGLFLGGAGVGALAGGAMAGPPGAVVGGLLGGFAPSLAQEYGGIRQDQKETGVDNKWRALAAAVPAALLDVATGGEKRILQSVLKKAAKKPAEEGALKYIGKEAWSAAKSEAPTEAAQSVMERWGAEKALTGEDALNDYAISAVKGGIGGAAMGGAAAIHNVRSAPKDLTKPAENEVTPPAEPLGLPNLPQTVDYTHADGSVEKMGSWTAAYNDTEREVAGTADTGWTPETAKAHADYVQSGGAERTYAEAAPTDNVRPYDPEVRQRAVSGLMQTEEGTQNLIDYHKSLQQSPVTEQAITALEDHLAELKKGAASAFSTKQPITPRGSLTEKGVQTQKSLLSHQIGEYLGKGLITPEQHMDFVNDLAQPGVKTLKVKSDVLKTIKDTRSAKVVEMQARKDAVIAEAAAKKVAVSEARKAARAAKKAVVPTKENQNAVQIKEPSKGVQRRKGPEVGLQKVGKGNAQPQEAAAKSEAKKEVKGPKLKAIIAVAKEKKAAKAAPEEKISAQEATKTKPPKAQQQETPAAVKAEALRLLRKVGESRKSAPIARPVAADIHALAKEYSDLNDEIRLSDEDIDAQTKAMDKINEFTKANKSDMKEIQKAAARLEEPQTSVQEEADMAVDDYGQDLDANELRDLYSETTETKNPTTAGKLTKTLKDLFRGAALFDRIVKIYATQADAAVDGNLSGAKGRVLGFKTPDGKIGLIAENIEDGKELGVFLHEVGVHLGMEKLVGKANMRWLDSRILEWAALNDGSKESEAAKAAVARSEESTTDDNAEGRIAYMVEELVNRGVKPKATVGGIEGWLYRLIGSMRIALVKLGLRSAGFSGQNLVDLAHGAAGIELGVTGRPAELSPERQGDLKFSEKTRAVGAKQIAEKYFGPAGERIVTDISHTFSKMVGHLEFLHNIIDRVKSDLPSAKTWHTELMKMSATKERWSKKAETIATLASKLGAGSYVKTNDFISKSTFEQKWGYQPEWLKNRKDVEGNPIEDRVVTVDPDMRKAWAALNQKERDVVDAVFEHGEEIADAKFALFKKLGISGLFSKMGKLDGPYAPLKRKGNYVAVLKSQALLDAEAAAAKEGATAKDAAKVEELKADEANFILSYFGTMGQAAQFAKEEGKKYAFNDAFAKTVQTDNKYSMGFKTLNRVMEALKADKGIPAEAKAAMEDTLKAMYMSSVDQHNARASSVRRKGRAGFDKNMVSSFLSDARAQAAFIANLEHGPEVNKAFFDMQEQVKDEKTMKMLNQDDFNLISAHYAKNMEYKDTFLSRLDDQVVGITSAWQLATSIGYHLNNLSQVLMVMVPKLAADYTYRAALKHTWAAYNIVKSLWKDGHLDISSLEKTKPALYKMLKVIEERNLLDVGMEENLSHFERTQSGYAAVDKTTAAASNAIHKLRQVARTVEMVNRIASAVAAYNIAVENKKSSEAATEYALDVVANTQGDFTRSDAPLILKNLPKVVGQYRKFQILMMTFYASSYQKAFHGATPEEKRIGKRMLAFKLAHTAVASGLLGFPLMNLAALVFGMAGGDEPDDLETMSMEQATKLLGSKDLATLLLRGPLAFTGLDMTKLGDNSVFSLLPYSDIDFTSRAGVAKTLMGAAGPAAGQLGRFSDGVGLIGQGDTYKGIEKFMPKGVEQAMASFRMANDGYSMKNGDVIVKPEDLKAFSLALNALGLTSTQIKEIQRSQNVQYQITQYYSSKTKEIEHEYKKAFDEKDTSKMAELRKDWMDMQKSKDEEREHFNFAPHALKKQPLSNLLRYPMLSKKAEREKQREQIPQ